MDFKPGDVLIVKKPVKVGTVETEPSGRHGAIRTIHGFISLEPGAKLFFERPGGKPCGSDDFSIIDTFLLEDGREVQVSYCRMDYMEEHFSKISAPNKTV